MKPDPREILKWHDLNISEFYHFLKERGEATSEDIGEGCGISKSAVSRYGDKLFALGLIEKEKITKDFPRIHNLVYRISPHGEHLSPSDFDNLLKIYEKGFEYLEKVVERGLTSVYELYKESGERTCHLLGGLQSLERKGYLESRPTTGKTSPYVFSLTKKGKEVVAKAKEMVDIKEKKWGPQPKRVREETSLRTYTEQRDLEFIEERGSITISELMEVYGGKRDNVTERLKSLSERGLLKAEKKKTKREYHPTEKGKRTVFFYKLFENPLVLDNPEFVGYPKFLRAEKIVQESEEFVEDTGKAPRDYQNIYIGVKSGRDPSLSETKRKEVAEGYKGLEKRGLEWRMKLGIILGMVEDMLSRENNKSELDYYLNILEEHSLLDEEFFEKWEESVSSTKNKSSGLKKVSKS